MQRNSYNTKQKEKILNIIKNKKKEFTAKDIYNDLNKKVGLTTIYRLIDKLVKEHKLTKSINDNNITYYQYLEECNNMNHFYLKCINCGELIHIDCECIDALSNHLFKSHNFIPNKEHIIINGICKKCSEVKLC